MGLSVGVDLLGRRICFHAAGILCLAAYAPSDPTSSISGVAAELLLVVDIEIPHPEYNLHHCHPQCFLQLLFNMEAWLLSMVHQLGGNGTQQDFSFSMFNLKSGVFVGSGVIVECSKTAPSQLYTTMPPLLLGLSCQWDRTYPEMVVVVSGTLSM
eukprot:g34871.t1